VKDRNKVASGNKAFEDYVVLNTCQANLSNSKYPLDLQSARGSCSDISSGRVDLVT
jgi:hypothetical protein